MNTTSTRNLELVSWKDISKEVSSVNKELGDLIDAIDPDTSYKFVKVTYLYGDIFIKNGEAQLPINDTLVPLTSSSIDKQISKELFYSLTPLFLMANKSNERFVDNSKRIIPMCILSKGDLSGTHESMCYLVGTKPSTIWSYSAGSRSIFMLPKITDKLGLKKLIVEYNLPTTNQIKDLTDHWEIFRNIAQHKTFDQSWQSTIIYFGHKWLDNKYSSKVWYDFKHYLLKTAWQQAIHPINKSKFNIYWESFINIICSRRLHPKPYIIDQVKHLLSITNGNYPGFAVVDNTQEIAPTNGLQKVFIECYELKQYLPTLLYCAHKNITPYLYYSLAIPTVLEGTSLKKTTSTIINDLRQIKLIIETLQKDYTKVNLSAEANKIIKDIQMDYFHYEEDIYNQVKPSSEIPQADNSFLIDKDTFPTRSFCSTSPFFSGCIRIKNNDFKTDNQNLVNLSDN